MDNLSQDDLNALLDSFGDSSPALEEQLNLSKQAGIADTFAKPAVEDMVATQSFPGKTAIDSAEILAPKELPVPTSNVYSTKQLDAANKLTNAAKGSVGSEAIELGENQYKHLPAVIESGAESSPSMMGEMISKGSLPLSVLYELLKGTPAGGSQDYPPNLPKMYGPELQPKSKNQPKIDIGNALINSYGQDIPFGFGGVSRSNVGPILPSEGSTPPKTPSSLSPNNETEDGEEDDKESSGASIGMKSSSVRPGGLGTENAGEGKDKDYLHDLINKVYGSDLQDDALKSAQAQAQQNRSNALLSKAGSQMGQAFARGRGVTGPADTSIQDELLKESNVPVENILQRRQAKTQELETGLKASDLIDREKLRDPSSNVSSAYRQMALTMMPGIAQYPNFNSMSAEGIKQLQPMIDTKIKMDVAKDNHQFVMLQKTQMDQAKAKADMTTRIASTLNRGAPAKAMDVDRRVDNINSLVQMYPDLNKMPQNQVNALTDEITQIVTGGMSTEGKSAKLMNPSLMSGFQNLMGKTLGKPTGAQLGLFIKEYIPYMHDLQQNARNYVKDQISPIMVGYNKRVNPSDMDEVKSSYTRYFSPQSEATHVKGAVTSQLLDDYAAKHNINREKAAELLKKAGYNVQGT